jgi:hypothetical protein
MKADEKEKSVSLNTENTMKEENTVLPKVLPTTNYSTLTSVKYYELTRDSIKHEDGLVNYKLTYLLAAQSLLFAAYGVVTTEITKNSMTCRTVKQALLERVLFWVPITGLVISVCTLLSLIGSMLSLKDLNSGWFNYCHNQEITITDFPHVYGRRGAFLLGWAAPIGLSILFCVVWVVFFSTNQV